MDTTVIPNEPNDTQEPHHLELEKAYAKRDKLYDRAMTYAAWLALIETFAVAVLLTGNKEHLGAT